MQPLMRKIGHTIGNDWGALITHLPFWNFFAGGGRYQRNGDGTVTLTVEAVCDTVICDDAVITHELTVRFAEDGSFQYLGNKILNDGILQTPDYQYRIKE